MPPVRSEAASEVGASGNTSILLQNLRVAGGNRHNPLPICRTGETPMMTPDARRSLTCAVLVLATVSFACASRRPARLFSPASAAKLDAPERDSWQKPQVLIDTLRIRAGMTVVDLGAGSGYLMPWLSRAVGPSGRVYAVEIQPEFVQMLKKRVETEKLDNVTVVQSTAVDVPLDELADRVVLLDTYRELEEPVAMLKTIKTLLKPTGRLVVVDTRPEEAIPGPPLSERVEVETVEAEARGAGFVATLQFDVLPRQYCLVFVNAEEIEATTDIDHTKVPPQETEPAPPTAAPAP